MFVSQKKYISSNETGISLTTLNWFIHVLINDIGYHTWVKMTSEEQAEHDEQFPFDRGYPYKVVQYPIPKGQDIILKDGKTHTISCDSEETRNMIIEMARSYDALEKKYHYSLGENASTQWHEVRELRPISPASSIRGPRTFLVSSPELCYVINGGISLGIENKGKWYVVLNGKQVEHKVTHYRSLPPHPLFQVPPYEDVKEEVERLKGTYND